jgi:hypothetical protein
MNPGVHARIIRRMRDGDETGALIDRVQSLLGGSPSNRRAIEDTLTEGYARALALDAESRRLERRISELAGLADGDRVTELAELVGRRTRADVELAHLRDVLLALRGHLAAAPVAS